MSDGPFINHQITKKEFFVSTDGKTFADENDLIVHEFYLILVTMNFNCDQQTAAQVVARFPELLAWWKVHMEYKEKQNVPDDYHSPIKPGAPTPVTNCNKVLQGMGVAYPRTCRVCGLGPCRELPSLTVTVTANEVPLDKPTPLYGDVDDNGPHF